MLQPIENHDLERIRSLDTPTLRAELSRALTITAQGLAYLAAVWAELERRGEDLSDLRHGLAEYLPRIADGTLAAEAVVAFAGQRTLLRRVAMLPLDEQRRLAAGERVPVWVPSDDGTDGTTRELPLSALTARQVAVVFDEDGRIRTPIEQRQLQSRTVTRRTRDSIVPTPTKRAEIRAALAVLSDDDLRRMAMERGYTLAPKCSIDGCIRPVQARTLCWQHYQRQRRAEREVSE